MEIPCIVKRIRCLLNKEAPVIFRQTNFSTKRVNIFEIAMLVCLKNQGYNYNRIHT